MPPHSHFSGEWGADGSGEYSLTYKAQMAGHTDLYIWCEAPGGVKEALPGAPFSLSVTAGQPTAASSYCDGFATVSESKKEAGSEAPCSPRYTLVARPSFESLSTQLDVA